VRRWRAAPYGLYEACPLQEIASLADRVRRATVPDPQVVTWQIDRNVNITNVCVSGCKFCNFHCKPRDRERAFVTTPAWTRPAWMAALLIIGVVGYLLLRRCKAKSK